MSAPTLALQWHDWLILFLHFAMLSLLSVGGVLSTAPEMHRFLVDQKHWLSDMQFNGSIALAQAAPGPNVLFVALFGWNIGMNAGGYWLAALGLLIVMTGVLLPSSLLSYTASRWAHKNRDRIAVRAFKQGMSPIVVSLMIATGFILSSAHNQPASDWPLWLLTALSVAFVVKTRLHLLWLLAAGALLGALGLL